MNRYVLYIAVSIVCIVLPVVMVIYGFWNHYQPKVGPIGEGAQGPSLYQFISIIGVFILGISNLTRSLLMYKNKRKTNQSKGKDNDA